MAIDVTCECGREFGVTNDSVGRSVKCPECGSWARVPAAVISVELERTTSDLANDPENQTLELRRLLPNLSLAVTETGWRLAASSTPSLTEALPFLIVGTSQVALVGFVAWMGIRGQLTSGALWLAPLFLAVALVIGCLVAMRLFGRIEITVEGNQGTVFTGAGTLGKTQHFDWTDALEITDEYITGRGGEEYHEIVLHAAKKIRTGKYLTEEQSSEIVRAIRQWQRTQPSDDYS